MTLFLASFLVGLESGGAEAAEETMNWTPYYAAGIALVVLLGAVLGMLVFGKGREHS